jgi:enoyl-[acyl-carrier-protein] reductase (NADH)
MGELMAGRRGLIMGVANEKSIAWAIAQACAAEGAELAFTYQGEALGRRVQPLAASVGSDIVLPCDVTDEPSLDAVFETLAGPGAGSTSCSTRSASPTRTSCAAAMSTRAPGTSPRR